MHERPRASALVVHGKNDLLRLELCDLLSREFDLETLILKEQVALGRSILDNFELLASKADVAFVLLTPDDLVLSPDLPAMRGRQNVIFELGYLYSKLGRDRVLLLYQETVELPSDLAGVLYYPFKDRLAETGLPIRRHLEALGVLSTSALGAKILIVDDDISPASSLYRQLERALGDEFELSLFNHPEEAIKALSTSRNIRACITDIVFRTGSTLSGVAVAERAIRAGIPTVAVTGHRLENLGVELAELQRLGMQRSRILRKPATRAEYQHFIDAIRRLPYAER